MAATQARSTLSHGAWGTQSSWLLERPTVSRMGLGLGGWAHVSCFFASVLTASGRGSESSQATKQNTEAADYVPKLVDMFFKFDSCLANLPGPCKALVPNSVHSAIADLTKSFGVSTQVGPRLDELRDSIKTAFNGMMVTAPSGDFGAIQAHCDNSQKIYSEVVKLTRSAGRHQVFRVRASRLQAPLSAEISISSLISPAFGRGQMPIGPKPMHTNKTNAMCCPSRWSSDPASWKKEMEVMRDTRAIAAAASFYKSLGDGKDDVPAGVDVKVICDAFEGLQILQPELIWRRYASDDEIQTFLAWMSSSIDLLKKRQSDITADVTEKLATAVEKLEAGIEGFDENSTQKTANKAKAAVEACNECLHPLAARLESFNIPKESIEGFNKAKNLKDKAQDITVGWAVGMLLANKDIRDPEKGVMARLTLSNVFTEHLKDKTDAHLLKLRVTRDTYNTVEEILAIISEGNAGKVGRGRGAASGSKRGRGAS